MKRGSLKSCKQGKVISNEGPIKILGISCANRSKNSCAKEDPISLSLLKTTLKEAEKKGAKTQLIDLRDLKIGICKECYSSCPAQCRFNEKNFMCDCYPRTEPTVFLNDGTSLSLEEAYTKLSKEEFLERIQNDHVFDQGDDMNIVYRAIMEADGIIFAGFTNYYGRPAAMQLMLSRLCALDGGVEKLWGDGKNLQNSIKYSKNKSNMYKQRLYGKFAAFINVSKEGDSVSPNLMKACTMMGMRIIPFSVAYRVNWYNEPTHRVDMKNSLNDSYTIALTRKIAEEMVHSIKDSDRKYGIYSSVV
jgi:multimeric flavodoxin WrbA